MEVFNMICVNGLFISFLMTTRCIMGQHVSNNTHMLYTRLLEDYNVNVRPCLDCATPLYVGLDFNLAALTKIDEIEGELSTVGFLRIMWTDERLTWDPKSNGIGNIIIPSTKIWTPIVLLGNPTKEVTHLNADDAITRVLYNGTVIWHPGDVFRSRCEYNVQNYPFDKQRCWIVFTPWSYLASEITFRAASGAVDTSFYQENGEWKLGPTSSSMYTKKGGSFVRFNFTFIRRSEFFVVNIIVPISFLSFLNCLAFAIPIESGERVSYTITVLLSFAVFMTLVSDNIPKTSAPMSLLCYYLTSLFSGSVLIMTFVTINMQVFYTNQKTTVTSKYIRLYKLVNLFSRKNGRNHDRQIDRDTNDNSRCALTNSDVDRTPPNKNVTWHDVAAALDKICLIIALVYFFCISFGMIMYITESKLENK